MDRKKTILGSILQSISSFDAKLLKRGKIHSTLVVVFCHLFHTLYKMLRNSKKYKWLVSTSYGFTFCMQANKHGNITKSESFPSESWRALIYHWEYAGNFSCRREVFYIYNLGRKKKFIRKTPMFLGLKDFSCIKKLLNVKSFFNNIVWNDEIKATSQVKKIVLVSIIKLYIEVCAHSFSWDIIKKYKSK